MCMVLYLMLCSNCIITVVYFILPFSIQVEIGSQFRQCYQNGTMILYNLDRYCVSVPPKLTNGRKIKVFGQNG